MPRALEGTGFIVLLVVTFLIPFVWMLVRWWRGPTLPPMNTRERSLLALSIVMLAILVAEQYFGR